MNERFSWFLFTLAWLVVAVPLAYVVAKLVAYGWRQGNWRFDRDHNNEREESNGDS